MPVHHRIVAATGASLAALAALGGAAAATTAGNSGTHQHMGTSAAAAALVQKLEANQRYPYTQVTLAVPRLAVPGISAADAAVATGLRIVIDSPKASKAAAAALVDLDYKATNLGELRMIGGNIYIDANVTKWAALPIKFSTATKQQLSAIDSAFGERWFELPAPTLGKLAHSKGGATLGSGLKVTQNPAALQSEAEASFAKLAKSLAVTQSPAPGGNVTYRATGSLQSLAASAGSAISAIDKSILGKAAKPVTNLGKSKGSYTFVFTTGGHGAYVSNVLLEIGQPGQGSIDFSVSFAHAVQPVVAPKGAKVLNQQTLSQLGL